MISDKQRMDLIVIKSDGTESRLATGTLTELVTQRHDWTHNTREFDDCKFEIREHTFGW